MVEIIREEVDEYNQRLGSKEIIEEVQKSLGLVRKEFYISSGEEERLEELSKRLKLNYKAILRKALTSYLDDHENKLTRTQYYENHNIDAESD